jgi:SAM-dependent methyltransferase
MRGQPHVALAVPEPYAVTADAYDRLVEFAITEWGESPRPVMARFLRELWRGRGQDVRRVLELCCGTGLMTEQLLGLGCAVTAVDRSAQMLVLARRRVGNAAEFHQLELPAPLPRRADAVVCTAAAFNYQSDVAALGATFQAVADVLEPGALFVFDIETAALFKGRWGNRMWAADQDDLAFIWNFISDPGTGYCDLHYTQFTRRGTGDIYDGVREVHRLYAFERGTIRELSRAAGFSRADVYDNYTSTPAGDTTHYETWVLTRDAGWA